MNSINNVMFVEKWNGRVKVSLNYLMVVVFAYFEALHSLCMCIPIVQESDVGIQCHKLSYTSFINWAKITRHCHNFEFVRKNVATAKVSEYHLIFNLNGILMVIGEGPTRFHLVVLKLGLKEFLYICVKKFIVYI